MPPPSRGSHHLDRTNPYDGWSGTLLCCREDHLAEALDSRLISQESLSARAAAVTSRSRTEVPSGDAWYMYPAASRFAGQINLTCRSPRRHERRMPPSESTAGEQAKSSPTIEIASDTILNAVQNANCVGPIAP